MPNALIINGYHPHPDTDGGLSALLVERAASILRNKGYTVAETRPPEGWDVETEIDKHIGADLVFLQSPVYWMGVSWSFQKYMDEVYSAGMNASMSRGDGRSRRDPDSALTYGMGGKLNGRYLLSLTFNAPRAAFDNPSQPFFKGRGVDDMFWPMHLNFRFFGLSPLPTFAIFDVHKNPDFETDLARFDAHLDSHA